MIAIKDMEMQTDCKECPLMGTDGIDEFSPMMCILLWAIKGKVKHCVEGEILDDCPLVEIVTCKDCKHFERLTCLGGQCLCPTNTYINETTNDFYCKDGERRE